MAQDPDKNEEQEDCPLCGETHEAGQSNCAKAAKQPLKIGAYTAQLCSFCGQKHRGGKEVCQGNEEEETPVLPGRKHRSATVEPASKEGEDTPLLPGRRPRNRKHKHKGTSAAKNGESERIDSGETEPQDGFDNDTTDGAAQELSFAPDDDEPATQQPAFNRSSQRRSRFADDDTFAGGFDTGGFDPTVRTQLKSMEGDQNAPEDLVGHTLSGRYALLELIGKGGMSAVYKAKDLKLNKFFAVKVLLPHLAANALSQQRFQVEAQAASSLSHPNMIVTHDFGVTLDGRPYLVMELLEGESLGDLLKKQKRLSLNRAVPIFIQICDALSHAHGKGVLHRDLKPSNVMITASSGVDFVRLLDFGIAKVLPQEGAESMGLTRTGEVFGSPNYMSPEQCQGMKVDGRSDLYSMGCLMYEVLSGKCPLVGENIMDTLLKQMNEPPPSFRSIDPDLNIPNQMELIIFKALAKNPQERFPSAEVLSEALRAFQQNVTVLLLKHIQDKWQVIRLRIRPLKRREKAMLIVAACATILAAGVGAKQMMSYYEMSVPKAFPEEKAFLPTIIPPPAAKLPEEDLLLRSTEQQGEMLHENPNSDRYDSYVNSLNDVAETFVQGNYFREAAECYRNLLELTMRNDGMTAGVTRTAAEHLADCNFKLGRYKEAVDLYKQLLEQQTRPTADQASSAVAIRTKEATCLYAQGIYGAAIDEYKRALRNTDQQNADYIISCVRLGECYRMRRLWKEAIQQYDIAAEAFREQAKTGNYSDSNRDQLRSALVDFYRAYCLYKLDKLPQAEKGYKSSIAQLKKINIVNDLIVSATMQYSDILWRQGSYIDAISTRMKARDLQNLLNE